MARTMRKQAAVALAVGVAGLCTLANAQDVPPVPDAMAVEGVPGMCVVPIWEYAGRWSQPDNGYNSPTQEACATDCAADPTCSGATFILYEPLEDQKNCWFKEWTAPGVATPCLPSDGAMQGKTFNALIKAADCTALEYKSEPLMCDVEMDLAPGEGIPGFAVVAPAPADAMAPDAGVLPVPDDAILASLSTPFVATADVDYSPNDMPPMGTVVEDLVDGTTQETATACAEACIAEAGCNAFTWMGSNPDWEPMQNCYLKTIEPGCTAPPEALAVPGAYLVMAQTPDCPMMPMMAPEMAVPGMVPEAVAGAPPIGADPFAGAGPVPAEAGPVDPIGFAEPPTETEPVVAAPGAPPPLAPTGPAPLDPISAGGTTTAAPNVEAGSNGAVGALGSALLAAALAAAVAVVA